MSGVNLLRDVKAGYSEIDQRIISPTFKITLSVLKARNRKL